MSAAEVIQLYDALPVQEQIKVLDHIIKTAIQLPEPKPQADFKELVNRVFDRHSQLLEHLAKW